MHLGLLDLVFSDSALQLIRTHPSGLQRRLLYIEPMMMWLTIDLLSEGETPFIRHPEERR